MVLELPRSELPVATVRLHGAAAFASDLRRWVLARWRWLQPRTVPVTVAVLGMLAVLGSAHYLSNLAHQPAERMAAPTLLLHPHDVAQLQP